MTQNGINFNLGPFKIMDKKLLKIIFKSPRLVLFGVNLTQFGGNSDPLGRYAVDRGVAEDMAEIQALTCLF